MYNHAKKRVASSSTNNQKNLILKFISINVNERASLPLANYKSELIESGYHMKINYEAVNSVRNRNSFWNERDLDEAKLISNDLTDLLKLFNLTTHYEYGCYLLNFAEIRSFIESVEKNHNKQFIEIYQSAKRINSYLVVIDSNDDYFQSEIRYLLENINLNQEMISKNDDWEIIKFNDRNEKLLAIIDNINSRLEVFNDIAREGYIDWHKVLISIDKDIKITEISSSNTNVSELHNSINDLKKKLKLASENYFSVLCSKEQISLKLKTAIVELEILQKEIEKKKIEVYHLVRNSRIYDNEVINLRNLENMQFLLENLLKQELYSLRDEFHSLREENEKILNNHFFIYIFIFLCWLISILKIWIPKKSSNKQNNE